MRSSRTFFATLALTCLSLAVTAAEQDWRDQAQAAAIAWHQENRPSECEIPDAVPASVDDLPIGEDTAAREALLIGFPCRQGAYNTTIVYLLSDQHGTVSEVTFPSPVPKATWYDGETRAVVESLTITETREAREVVNAVYDPSGRTMSGRDTWRAAGDAFSSTQWGFNFGRFEIMRYEVDASFDGQQNPEILIEKEIW